MGLGPPFMTLSSENISETAPEYLMLVQKYQVIRNKGRSQDNVWHSCHLNFRDGRRPDGKTKAIFPTWRWFVDANGRKN